MKRIFIAGIFPIFLLIACTDENSTKEEPTPTPPIETQQLETTTQIQTQTQIDTDKLLTNAEEAMVFLEKAAEITSNLETVWFLSMFFNTSYSGNVDELGQSTFSEYNSTYEGTMQRNPKLAYIIKSIDNSSGTLVDGMKDSYDESSRLQYSHMEYFDFELGWFSVSGDYSYGEVVENDEQPYIQHYDLDASFKTLEHIDDFMQLFMSYPDQLSIYKDSYEDIELDNWIIELKLTNEQYFEHFNMLEFNLFTGSYFDVDSNELYFVQSEKLRDLYLALTFDPSYNLVQLTVNHTYNALEDYVGANDYFTTIYYTFFSDYNVPYTHRVPEDIILNADYN